MQGFANDLGANTPDGAGSSVYTIRLNSVLFDGVRTKFYGVMPAQYDGSMGVPFVTRTGVGPLRMVRRPPGSTEFLLSGALYTDIEFGEAPDAGDEVYVTLVV